MNKKYEPFGDEWEKTMLQFTKPELIGLYKRACEDLVKLRKADEPKERRDAYIEGYIDACQMHAPFGFDRDCNGEMKEALKIWENELVSG